MHTELEFIETIFSVPFSSHNNFFFKDQSITNKNQDSLPKWKVDSLEVISLNRQKQDIESSTTCVKIICNL